MFAKVSNGISFDRFCKSNVEQMPNPINGNYIIECFVTQQGPNYAIAKRIQHWRAFVAKRAIRKSIHAMYERVWSSEHNQFFYYNVKTLESRWTKPALLGPDDLTPRFYD